MIQMTLVSLESVLDLLFRKKVIINCDHQPYLHRWFVVRYAWLGIFIHKFIRSDEDRALHDHPWPFIVIPIWRGYIEHSEKQIPFLGNPKARLKTRVKRRVQPILGTRIRPATFRHRVELLKDKPSWSIFIRFKRWREWGFWEKEGFVLWNKWWQDKCE